MVSPASFLAAARASAATEALATSLREILVSVRSRAGGGSGTAWARDGLIVTNHHVVPDDAAEVRLADGRQVRGDVVRRAPESDLAAIRVSTALTAVAVPRTEPGVRAGELAFAMGNPWAEPGVITHGIVTRRGPATAENALPLVDAIQADIRLAPGNSGGPLADAAGRVIGINSMIAGGMGIAIPASTVERFLAGQEEPGFLGISGRPVPLPEAIAASYGASDGFGLLITDVVPGSPASAAGLIPGDVVLRFDEEHAGLPSIARRLRHLRAGLPLRIELLRGHDVRTASAEPVARS